LTAGPLVEASPNSLSAGSKDYCSTEAMEKEEKSIYAALGWDDDGYEQLA
jgi:hypothetical protein